MNMTRVQSASLALILYPLFHVPNSLDGLLHGIIHIPEIQIKRSTMFLQYPFDVYQTA